MLKATLRLFYAVLVKDKLEWIKKIIQADEVCIWGASGKGVIFLSQLPEAALNKISHVIDINFAKQGKFLPVSGKRIEGPDVLKHLKGKPLVLIMNEIYMREICARIDEMSIEPYTMCA